MYKILQSTDWSFLIGGEVQQVAIGLHDVQIHLFKDMGIGMTCDFEHKRPWHILPFDTEMHVKAATLVSLPGKKVEGVTANGEESLIVRFTSKETLTIIVDDEPYESFVVTKPGETIVV
jgi:hypothetical protein